MNMPVTSLGWTLHYTIGDLVTSPVPVGAEVKDFRGDVSVISGGRAPHKSSSSGRVYVMDREYYPGVFGLKWVEDVA